MIHRALGAAVVAGRAAACGAAATGVDLSSRMVSLAAAGPASQGPGLPIARKIASGRKK